MSRDVFIPPLAASGASDYDGWLGDAIDIMSTAAPALTNFEEIKLGNFPLGAAISTDGPLDASVPGGGVTQDATDKASLSFYSLFQTPATTSWAFAAHAKLLEASVGHFNFVGLINAAGAHYAGVASYPTVDAANYVLYTYDGQEVFAAATFPPDTAYHTFIVTFNGTTIKLFIDGVEEASTATLTGLTNQAMYPGITATLASRVVCTRFAYGYIVPT